MFCFKMLLIIFEMLLIINVLSNTQKKASWLLSRSESLYGNL